MKKILFIKSGVERWYIESHIEYLIRYLGNEFYIKQSDVPYPPYKNYLDRFPETSPLQQNPDDYDLLIPELGTHPHVDFKEYGHKMGVLSWEGLEGYHDSAAVVGTTTPSSEQDYANSNIKCHSLRVGIDTELFKPMPINKTDKLHVGFIGSTGNPRHRAIQIYRTLKDLDGIELMVFPHTWKNTEHEILQYDTTVDTKDFVKYIKDGIKEWTGIPNCYNQMDVLVRVEQSEEYGFPVLEAAACGVPIIATNWGNAIAILDAGGGIKIDRTLPLEEQMVKMKDAVLEMKAKPEWRKHMGELGRAEVEKNWTWDKHLGNWREYFKEGLQNARSM